MTAPRLPRIWPGIALLAALAACRAQETATHEEVVTAAQHGRYAAALERARELLDRDPNDPQAQKLYRDAQVASLLDQAREEVFHGDLTRGLAFLEQARDLAPDNATVQSWIEKTHAQLATHWLDVAADHTAPEELSEAEQAYEKVLSYDPDNTDAKRGLSHVLLLKNYRGGLSKTYFDDGLSSFQDLLLQQAHRSFAISRRYRENEPAALRQDQVETMMATERLESARSLEEQGLFFAARNEYRLVLLIDPKNVEGRAGLDRMDRETRASRTLAGAEMQIRRGELDDARKSLDQAHVLTEVQADQVTKLESDIEEKKLDEMYLEAQSDYLDFKYPEAVAAYERLLAIAPDYRDAALRKQTIEEFIRLAEEFYAKALAAKDDAEAEEYLRAIHPVIWPEYRDVVQRLEAIEKRKAAAAKDAAPSEPKPEDGDGGR